MRRLPLLFACLGPMIVASPELRGADAKPDPARVEFFESKVRPILATHCLSCHGSEKQKAGLRLDSKPSMMRGGDSGPVIQPGDAENSRLIQAIRYHDELKMPPKGRLKEPEIAALTDWVKTGAVWPEAGVEVRPAVIPTASKITAADREFWAFRPVGHPAPPTVKNDAWARSPIDQFILAKLEEKGLQPVAPATKRALIRRATFDLIGLPPTPADVEAFVADQRTDAYERLIDRLLASPHYGERWGRHWLDVARYGEDQAHTFEARLYPYGFRYRDWVVAALNADMPYDQFVTEQIAGDLIDGPGADERRAAVGLFALGPVYYGRAVLDELDDRVDTLCRGFLGLTVACARCHDHKFDPITQKDYYGLAGVFASTTYKEYPKAPADEIRRYNDAQDALAAKTKAISEFLKAEGLRWSESQAARSAKYMAAAWTLTNRRKRQPELTSAELARAEQLDAFFLDRWVKYLYREGDDTRPHLARWRAALAKQDRKRDLSTDAEARAEIDRVATAFQDYVLAAIRARDALGQLRTAAEANLAGTTTTALALSGPEGEVVRDIVSSDGIFALPPRDLERRLPDASKAVLRAMRAELEKMKKEMPAKYAVTHSLADASTPTTMKVHLRGNPATLGESAPHAFLAVLSPEKGTPFPRASGRLELARAIASKNNPLTARVLVNRIWEHHFGRGLVATPSNFGKLGDRPSHPELLDYLAARFMDQGWSLKNLHRQIMLSSTYQLGTDSDSHGNDVDPGNTLLWRANRRRLEVEAWRDAMLAVSGQLDLTMGGPSAKLTSPTNRRRTLYGAISRHDLDGLLRLFDFPDPNITSDKRTVTTVPLQQLFVLNSPFMERQAKALAARLTADPAEPDSARIQRAFPLLFGRPATDRDISLGIEFLNSTPAPGNTPTKWEQYAQVLLGTNEFAFVD
jgi:cytochrome c553